MSRTLYLLRVGREAPVLAASDRVVYMKTDTSQPVFESLADSNDLNETDADSTNISPTDLAELVFEYDRVVVW